MAKKTAKSKMPSFGVTAFSPSETSSEKIEYEFVNHPPHYNDLPNGIECIDVIEHFPANISFAMKHLWRAGKKPGSETQQDLDKALWYINRQKKLLAGDVRSMSK